MNQETAAPTITLYPAVSVCRYTVEIRNAKNLKYVSGVGSSISGLAGGLLPGAGADALTGERVTIPFDAVTGKDKDGEKTVITGGLLTFGHKAGNNHTLTVYAVLADGSKWYYTYDVTDQIHSAPDPAQRAYRPGRASPAQTDRQRRRFPTRGRGLADRADRYRDVVFPFVLQAKTREYIVHSFINF